MVYTWHSLEGIFCPLLSGSPQPLKSQTIALSVLLGAQDSNLVEGQSQRVDKTLFGSKLFPLIFMGGVSPLWLRKR